MTISKETMQQTIELAKIDYPTDQLPELMEEMERIVSLVEVLNELDTEGIEPTYHGIQLQSVMREDKAVNNVSREDLLFNAPSHANGFIQVPAVISEGGHQ